MEHVIHHAARVANFQTAGFDSAHSGRPDDGDVLLASKFVQFARHVLRNALCDDGDGADLFVVHGFERALVSGAQRGEVDEYVGRAVLLHGVVHALVDGDEDLLVAPVEFLLVVARERVDHCHDGRLLAAAHEIEIQHGLHGSRLHAPDYRLGRRREQWLAVSLVDTGAVFSVRRLVHVLLHDAEILRHGPFARHLFGKDRNDE